MNYTPDQKRAIDSVLSVFETGKVPTPASYSTCTILADGAGISYGKHQCTDRAGSLDAVVKAYILGGGRYAADLRSFVPYLESNFSTKEPPGGPWSPQVRGLVDVLVDAGSDPVMQQAQDAVFDRDYFTPAVNHAVAIGLTQALSLLVVYDTCIHSGPRGVDTIRVRFPEKSPAAGGDERAWVSAYLNARRAWLAGNSNPVVQKTVYRIDALADLVRSDNWTLAMPFTVRKVTVS